MEQLVSSRLKKPPEYVPPKEAKGRKTKSFKRNGVCPADLVRLARVTFQEATNYLDSYMQDQKQEQARRAEAMKSSRKSRAGRDFLQA